MGKIEKKAADIHIIYVKDPRFDVARMIDILKRHNSGEAHTTIAASFGITRERVRTIIKKAGGEPRQVARDDMKDERVAVISEMNARGISIDAIADELGISQAYVRVLASTAGIRCRTASSLDRRKKLKRAAGFVLQGASYNVAASKVGMSSQHVRVYCRAVGILSSHISRNPAFSSSKTEPQHA